MEMEKKSRGSENSLNFYLRYIERSFEVVIFSSNKEGRKKYKYPKNIRSLKWTSWSRKSWYIRSGIGTFPYFLHNQPLLDPDTQGLTLDFHTGGVPISRDFWRWFPPRALAATSDKVLPLSLPRLLSTLPRRERLSITIERRPRVYRLVRNSNQLYAVGTQEEAVGAKPTSVHRI